jgi:indolepyruvate ferredoxin oxidoreductase alpha subunit
MDKQLLLGDEAIGIAALDAGISAAYGYPGTPSTEILEYIIEEVGDRHSPVAKWCSNEKTAYEDAIGTSYVGKRALVTMKHVGLNVAADPFVNSALLGIKGGLVLAVADDPGMHSSQNEQDSRYYADLAHVPCLEPRNQQEAYDMTVEAFDLSERLSVPVMVRLTTRLSHSRGMVEPGSSRSENPPAKATEKTEWMLLPGYARKRWAHVLERQGELLAWSESSERNILVPSAGESGISVITTGMAGNYFEENKPDLAQQLTHLHIGAYPIPVALIRKAVAGAERVIVLEEGYPYLERYLRGLLDSPLEIIGKTDGVVPPSGELTPDNVRPALGLAKRRDTATAPVEASLPMRPPQLCAGCPHTDSYRALREATDAYTESVVSADIGCYALGALPPHAAVETIVCMGASIGVAKGAAEAGVRPAVAVIGDSTFLHSGVTSLVDAVSAETPMTIAILDNETVAMTGGQETILPSSRLRRLIEGAGVDPDHVIQIDPRKRNHEENVLSIRRELEYEGVSVILSVRPCIEAARKNARRGCADEE